MGLFDFLRTPSPLTADEDAPLEDDILSLERAALEAIEVAQADPRRLFHPSFGAGQLNPSLLVSRRSFEIFDKIRKDDQVRAAMQLRKGPIASAKWDLHSPEGMDTLDANGKITQVWEPTEYVDWTLRQNLRRPLEWAIKNILTCKDYGYSVSELVFDVVEGGRWDGALTLADIKTRRPKEIRFNVDPHGNLTQLIQEQNPGGLVSLPIPKFLICVNELEWGNFYGTSEFEYIYPAWWAKTAAYKWFLMGMERYGTPPIIAGYNPGGGFTTKVLNQVKKILKNLAARTVSVIPRATKEDLEIIIPDIGEKMAAVFVQSFPLFDRWIARGLLIPGQIGMAGEEQSGSLAKAKVHFDTFLLVMEEDKRMVERIMTHQLIPRLVDLEFGPQEAYPEFRFAEPENTQIAEIAQTWVSLTGVGVVTNQIEDEEWLRVLLGAPEIDREQLEKTREEGKKMAEKIAKGKGGSPFGGGGDDEEEDTKEKDEE